jgi:3-oxoacyl-[acyl-carrier-protein] synthase II
MVSQMIYPRKFNYFIVSMFMPNTIVSMISTKLSIHGPMRSFNAACASSTVAIGNAYKAIKNNEVDIAIAGGSEYLNDCYGSNFRAFDVMKTIAKSAEKICPFDKKRDGFLFSEGGAGILILENLGHAKNRNVSGIAEIIGYAENSDGYNKLAPEPEGKYIAEVLDLAFEESNLRGKDIDYINPNGTGSLQNDSIEAKIIKNKIGSKPYISATKSLTGHVMGASGAIETIVTALSIKDQTSHICKDLTDPIEDLNFVLEPKKIDIYNALKMSNGFGGHNCALVLKRIVN